MKLFTSFLLITLTVSATWALPARNPQDDAEVIAVPRRQSAEPDFRDFKGVIDTGSGYPFLRANPPTFSHNFGFIDSFDDLFRRLHARIWPIGSGEDTPTSDSDESGAARPSIFSLRPFSVPDLGKDGKTTSTVKVVDGHKVEVNETTYGDSNSVFKVRVVNVRPLESGEDVAEGTVTNNKDDDKPAAEPAYGPSTSGPLQRGELDESDEDERREPLEKQPAENEVRDIDGTQFTTTTKTSTLATDLPAEASEIQEQQTQPTEVTEIMADLIEHVPQEQLLEELEEQEEQQFPQEQQQQQEQTISHLALQTQDVAENVESAIQDNEETEALHDSHNESAAIEEFGEQLSSDESDAKPQQQQQQQKEREHFESSDDEDTAAEAVEMSAGFNEEWETLAEDLAHANDASNDLDNRIDGDETFVPIDLSNDIAVNDIAAAQQDFPHNPDAELIDVVKVLPKFEKLTLAVPAAPEQLHQQQQQQSELHMLVK